MRTLLVSLLLLAASLPASSFAAASRITSAGATITVINNDGVNEGFNDPTPAAPVGGNPGLTIGEQRLIAFQFAADIWASVLDSNVEIRVDAQFNPLACTATSATLGSAGTVFIYANYSATGFFPGPEFGNTWYPSALAKKRAGFDINPGALDIRARFNSNLGNVGCLTGVGWYLGLDGNHGSQIDLVAVLLHELGHGLGFQQFASLGSGAQTNNFTDVYGRHLLDTTTGLTWNLMTNAQRVASAVNSRRVVWTGAEVTAGVPAVLTSGTPLMQVTSPGGIAGNYSVGSASFGPQLESPGVSGEVVLVDDGVAPGPDGCTALVGFPAGKIALIDRGTCTFVIKALNAQAAGAIAVIIADNVAGAPPAGLGGTDPTITIPSVRITLADGNLIKAALASETVTATLGVDLTVRAGADGMGRALIYTPNPVIGGSSVSHWDPIAFKNLLMEPSINDDLTHILSPPEDLSLPLMRDIGWFPDDNLNGIPNDMECAFTCPGNMTVATDPGSCDAVVTYNVSTTGICGVVTCSPESGSVFPLGTTTVTCQSETGASCSFDVTVEDQEAPAIAAAKASRSLLWPPYHGMHDVMISYDVTENCPDGQCMLSVSSNEPENGLGDGDMAPDWEVVDANLVRLRAERSGTGSGRIYTVTITCTDAAGNSSSKSVTVVVPLSQAGGRGSVTSGPEPEPVEIAAPREVSFALAGPNPPVGSALFRLGLPQAARVDLVIYDVAGRRVGTVLQGTLGPGWHTASWDLARAEHGLGSGVYFARMTIGGVAYTRRLVMLR